MARLHWAPSAAVAVGVGVSAGFGGGCVPYRAMPLVLPEPPLSYQDSTGPLSYEAPTPADAAALKKAGGERRGAVERELRTDTVRGHKPVVVEGQKPGEVGGEQAGTVTAERVARNEVTGTACQRGFTLPLVVFRGLATGDFRQALTDSAVGAAWGDGGYGAAMADAQAQAPGAGLFDVRADLQVLSILGVYREWCVRVTAAVKR